MRTNKEYQKTYVRRQETITAPSTNLAKLIVTNEAVTQNNSENILQDIQVIEGHIKDSCFQRFQLGSIEESQGMPY